MKYKRKKEKSFWVLARSYLHDYIMQSWTGGRGSSISAESPLCYRWSCHLCA